MQPRSEKAWDGLQVGKLNLGEEGLWTRILQTIIVANNEVKYY